jgi:hypothetical protein
MREATAETASERLWQPEVLLPSQITSRKIHMDLPELQLVAAILEDAIHCVARNAHTRDRRRAREYRDAREWLLDDRRDWLFSFHNVCELLSLESRAVRAWVLKLLDARDGPQHRRPPVYPTTARRAAMAGLPATAPRPAPGALRAPGTRSTQSAAEERNDVGSSCPLTIPARRRQVVTDAPHRWRPCLHFFATPVVPYCHIDRRLDRTSDV